MKRILLTLSVLAAFTVSTGAAAGGTSGPSASVESVAVVVFNFGTTATTNFNFDVLGCPEGEVISITWEAEQAEPDTSTSGEGLFIFSTGDPVQHFVVSTIGSFRPGYLWTGSGVVTCGATPIPVSGGGPTKSVSGV